VRTQYGFHIIRIDDVRDPQFPPYEQVKDEVAKQLIGKQRDKVIEDLRKTATIE
jgi:peptidyl-prolyl cis-trans isomerase C